MSGILKIAGKVGLVLVASFGIGYAEYRLKGGKPIHQLYKEVQNERLACAMASAKSESNAIKTEGTVK